MKFSHGSAQSRGVLIAFKKGSDVKILNEYSDDNGRILALKCKIQDHSVLLVSFYNANQQNEQLEALENLNRILLDIDLEPERKIILGGDFNLIVDIKLESDRGKPTLIYSSISKVELIKEQLDLCDIFRVCYPTARRFTWRCKTPFMERRLDYFFVSDELQDNVLSVDIKPSICSDHSAMYLKVGRVEESNRGVPVWRFNNSLINDEEYVLQMTNIIELCRQNDFSQFSDPRVKWEYMKYRIRDFSIKYSKEKSKERKKSVFLLRRN